MSSDKLVYRREQYLGEPDVAKLNHIDIWIPDLGTTPTGDGRIWVIYIHGGAWRDPEVGSESFEPSIREVWRSPLKDSIAGFASIDYRLSPYPSHPTYPSSHDDASRNVHYPAHMTDVAQALLYMDQKYNIKNAYILIGHSAGGTMAFELPTNLRGSSVPQAACVLGIAGIYHFNAFLDSHSGIPIYREIMENAFPDRSLWDTASPCMNRVVRLSMWEHARFVIISHSDADELVEKAQASLMLEHARSSSVKAKILFLPATGAHDEIWRSGSILADLITKSISLLRS